jgi:hypothetical protein
MDAAGGEDDGATDKRVDQSYCYGEDKRRSLELRKEMGGLSYF